MSDDVLPATAPPGLARWVVVGGILLTALGLAAGLLLDDPAEWVADRVAPWPILVLAVVTLVLMMLARIRGATPVPFASAWQRFAWVMRFAFATAAAILVLIWIGPWIAGLKVARELFQGVLLITVSGVVLALVGSSAANLLRTIRGTR